MVRPKLVQFNFLKLLTAPPDTNSMLVCTPLQILLEIAAFVTQIPDSFETDAKTHTDFTRSASSTEKEKIKKKNKGEIKFFIFPVFSGSKHYVLHYVGTMRVQSDLAILINNYIDDGLTRPGAFSVITLLVRQN